MDIVLQRTRQCMQLLDAMKLLSDVVDSAPPPFQDLNPMAVFAWGVHYLGWLRRRDTAMDQVTKLLLALDAEILKGQTEAEPILKMSHNANLN